MQLHSRLFNSFCFSTKPQISKELKWCCLSVCAAKCARAHFTSKCSRPSHRPPQRRPTLLLRACIYCAQGGEWYEPADEAKLRGHVQRQAHTRTILLPDEIQGKEIPEYTGGRRARNTKSFAKQVSAHVIAHAWPTPEIFLFVCPTRGLFRPTWAFYDTHKTSASNSSKPSSYGKSK